jgi:phosphoenolpyruvate-protein kinase (PTS system EI component)
VLAGIGVNSVSAAAPAIPGVRTRLAMADINQAKQAAELAMKASSPTQAKTLVKSLLS